MCKAEQGLSLDDGLQGWGGVHYLHTFVHFKFLKCLHRTFITEKERLILF